MHTYGAVALKPGPQSRGIRAGQLVADPPPLVPDGDVHAVDKQGRAACGLTPPHGFLWPNDEPAPEWGTRGWLSQCRACEDALR